MLAPARRPGAKGRTEASKAVPTKAAPSPLDATHVPLYARMASPLAHLRIGAVGDRYEREADAVADAALRSPAGRDPVPRAGSADGVTLAATPLPTLERHIGRDVGDVRIHHDGRAARSAAALHARAYTVGRDIVFAAGHYQPDTDRGRRLLVHELVHVVQQRDGGTAVPELQRDCSDAAFCTPYPTVADADSAEANLRSFYLPADEQKFGPESRDLFERFLSRSPGDSLSPVLFTSSTNPVVESFADSWASADDQDKILDLIGARLPLAPGPLRDHTPTTMSVENFLSRAELDDRPINYWNPLSIAGHIAGGIGSSDAGNDYRKVEWGNVTLERIPLTGGTGYVHAETTLHYEVFDAIDFCPGDCGSPAEQLVTIPMSRLEAGGQAYDQPFKVRFVPPSRSKRFWF